MNQMEKSPLLLIGASVRAAAQSARGAGFEPLAIDLFGDRDLRQVAQVQVSKDYPVDIPRIAGEMPDAPFLYAGAIENSPEVISELSRYRTLWGNDSSVVKLVRNPFRLQTFLKEAAFPIVPIRMHDDPPVNPAGWLVKPYRSAHGSGIRHATEQPLNAAFYFQRLLSGVPVGAAFLANGRECRLLGTHRQLVGLPEDTSEPFRFCGAVAPARITTTATQTISEIGSALTQWAGLTGLFGCDFVLNSEGPFLLEVNPRYTAAMELWEILYEPTLIGDHVRACKNGLLPELTTSIPQGNVLKLILYAPQPTVVPERLEEVLQGVPNAWLADLPDAGTSIDYDHPVCTLLVSGETISEFESALKAAIHAVRRVCGWSGDQFESMYCDLSARIAAEFT